MWLTVDRRGNTYVTVIIILTALSVMASVVFFLTANDRISTAAFSRNAENYYLARSGAEMTVGFINNVIDEIPPPLLKETAYLQIQNKLVEYYLPNNLLDNSYIYEYEITYDDIDIAMRRTFSVESKIYFYVDRIEIVTHAKENDSVVGTKMTAVVNINITEDNKAFIKTLKQNE